MDRSAKRELAFKFLYSMEIQKKSEDENMETLVKLFIESNNIIDDLANKYVLDIANGVNDNLEKILVIISENLKVEWQIERISKVNISLLKLAIYEILYKKVPFKIVINEVVELAKRYGEDQSSSFINGVLANVVKEI